MGDLRLECLRCRALMERGYLLDRGHGNAAEVAKWIEGEPDRRWYGIRTKGHDTIDLQSYRCPKCGYVELHAPTPTGE
jgi:hypothetical protein